MLKKIIGINLLIVVLIGLVACSKKNEEVKTTKATEKETSNFYFTNEYFEGVKSISSFTSDKVITDKKILDYAGTSILKLAYEDGTEKNISYTSELILINDKTYSLEKDIAKKIASYF